MPKPKLSSAMVFLLAMTGFSFGTVAVAETQSVESFDLDTKSVKTFDLDTNTLDTNIVKILNSEVLVQFLNLSLQPLETSDLNLQTETLPSLPNNSQLPDNAQSGLNETSLDSGMEQMNSVSQLSDIRPTDWAFQALKTLVERYGCVAGYPNGTYGGNRALTRYEFAAGLNACLDRINRLMSGATTDSVRREDLAILKKLQDEFAIELGSLRRRVDVLGTRTSDLESRQFSTTTRLFGQVVMGAQVRSRNEFQTFLNRFSDTNTNFTFTSNTQINLLTQLSPRSMLLVGLQAGNGGGNPPSLDNFARLSYQGDTNNNFQISDLTYRQIINDNFALIVGTAGVSPVNVFRGVNRLAGTSSGPLSVFAQRNPIISIGGGRSGVGFDWQVAPALSLQGVYSTNSAENPQNGLFGGTEGSTTLGLQLVMTPVRTLDLSFQYINSYSPFGSLSTGVGDDQLAVLGSSLTAPINTNALGVALEWRATRELTFGGWFGYTTSTLQGSGGSVETANWMAFLTVRDLFGAGNVGGIFIGQPPKITSSNLTAGRNIPSFINRGDFFADPGGQPGTATHLETYYQMRLSDNISITPGVIIIFSPGHNSSNNTITIGGIRTTFTF